MMHPGTRSVSAALLALLCVGACARDRTAKSETHPPETETAVQGAVPPRSSPAIVVPKPTMKTVNSDAKPSIRTMLTDPLLPTGSETPRLPNDFVIGRIGGGDAVQEAYLFVMAFLEALGRNEDVSGLFSENGKEDAASAARLVSAIGPASPRAGSGVFEESGEVSFLVRFVGKERSSQGEVHLVRSGSSWLVDEFILGEPEADYGADGRARFDPFTYTRFL